MAGRNDCWPIFAQINRSPCMIAHIWLTTWKGNLNEKKPPPPVAKPLYFAQRGRIG